MDTTFWTAGGQGTPSNNGNYATGSPPGQNLRNVPSAPKGVHSDGSNYLAADGHVKWLHAAAISPGKDATSATNPEDDTNHLAAGTGYMNVGAGNQGSATLTFSKI